MPFLSPAKLLIILVVALVVLGPDKLPRAAKQIGSFWADLRTFRQRIESEVRGTFPDLPSTDRITQAVRSPLSFLDGLADTHGTEASATSVSPGSYEPFGASGDTLQMPPDANQPAGTVRAGEAPLVPSASDVIPGVSIAGHGGVVHQVRSAGPVVPDDPSLN